MQMSSARPINNLKGPTHDQRSSECAHCATVSDPCLTSSEFMSPVLLADNRRYTYKHTVAV